MKRGATVFFRNGCVVLTLAIGRMTAQDVTEAPLQWVQPQDAPDTLPVRKRPFRPEFPSELKKTADIGWGVANIFVDAKGTLRSFGIYATQPAFERAIAAGDSSRKFEPGRRDGEPVNTRVRLTTIFNPASAAKDGPNATPRLLEASLVTVPEGKRRPAASTPRMQVVWATLALDEKGTVTAVSDVPSELQPLLEAGVPEWRFAPARREGKPVAATVRVPFILVPPEDPVFGKGEPPRPIKRTPPVYPFAMRSSGLRGDVVVEFVVDTEGRVKNPVVVRTLNPGFNEAALEAMRGWRFEPARLDGRPVNTRMQQAISFQLQDMPDGGDDGIEVRRRGDVSKLPPELRYDTPPKMAALEAPRYPYALLRDGVRGTADVVMVVAPSGRVIHTRIVEADHAEFGYALQAAAERFEYLPAVKEGRPTQTALRFAQKFTLNLNDVAPEADKAALRIERKQPERILNGAQLDGKLRSVAARPPLFPRSIAQHVGGRAEIEFIVDEEGRVVLPRIVSASAPEFGYAAMQATATWRFEPPTSGGKPALARARVPFEFAPPALAAPAEESPTK